MKETGILFTPSNHRLILSGDKVQTRRVISPQPVWDAEVKFTRNLGPLAFPIGSMDQQCGCPVFTDGRKDGVFGIRNLHGGVGDRLYVKEGIILFGDALVGYYMDGVRARFHEKRLTAMFMAKRYARTWLELTDVRVERLQSISEEDAIAEGIGDWTAIGGWNTETAKQAYAKLWDSINKTKHPWSQNDWVFALTFKKL